MDTNTMKLICEYPPGTLRNATTVANLTTVATGLRVMPGVGKPFLIFQSLPGQVASADFDLYPQYIVSAVVADNLALINEALATPPLDALGFV